MHLENIALEFTCCQHLCLMLDSINCFMNILVLLQLPWQVQVLAIFSSSSSQKVIWGASDPVGQRAGIPCGTQAQVLCYTLHARLPRLLPQGRPDLQSSQP